MPSINKQKLSKSFMWLISWSDTWLYLVLIIFLSAW